MERIGADRTERRFDMGPESGYAHRATSRRALAIVLSLALVGVVVLGFAGLRILRSGSGFGSGFGDTSGAADLTAGGPSAQTTAAGLTMTLRLSRGPYFLSELVAARITLANDTHAPVKLQGAPMANDCSQALTVALAGGGPPTYALPTRGFVSCPLISSVLHPGQMWTIDELLPLTASGSVTLTASAHFIVSATGPGGARYETSSDGPFAGRWPTLHIAVAATVPVGHAIILRPATTATTHQVGVSTSGAAAARFYAISDIVCADTGQGFSERPDLTWRPVSGTTLTQPSCSGSKPVWTYSVGTPGFAIASGNYPAHSYANG